MNKKGFTLVEILVVIVIIGGIAMLIVPRISDVFGKSTTKAMKVQENEINASALIYLEDFCKNPIGSNTCPGTISRNTNKTVNNLKILLIFFILPHYSFDSEFVSCCKGWRYCRF